MAGTLSAGRRRPWRGRPGQRAPLIGAAAAAPLLALAALVWPAHPPTTMGLALLAVLLLGFGLGASLRAHRSERLRRALAVGVSHDMRTPLAQIRMFTEMLLLRRERCEDERVRWLEAIERESHRLGEVMENVLLFVQAEEQAPFPARRSIDLGALIEDVAAEFAPQAAARGMRVETDPPPGLLASLDVAAVRQALRNLLDNALRFGPAGQTVSVTLTTDGAGEATITVEDGGPGVPLAERERVWQPFAQGGAEAVGGGGLGLAVVRGVAEAHAGRAWIDAAPGGGARVHLALPFEPAAGEPHIASTPGVGAGPVA